MTTPTPLRPRYTPFDIEAWQRENAPAPKATDIASIARPATESDLLTGVEAIAQYLDWPKRRALYQHEKGLIPTFRQGRLICALRSALDEHFAELSRLAMQNRKGR